MENIIVFVGGSSIIAVILIAFLKKWIKNNILPRWGDLGVQLVLLAVALILAIVGYYSTNIPTQILETTGKIFTGAMVIYQVLIKAVIQKAILGKLDLDDK